MGRITRLALDAARPLTIERKLNAPSICEFWLSLPEESTAWLCRDRFSRWRLKVTTARCTSPGYIAVSPLPSTRAWAWKGRIIAL